MIDGKNLFDQPIKYNEIAYENIRKIASDQGDDYTRGCLLDYAYFRDYYKIVAIDLSKKQSLNSDCKAIQLINFTANLDRAFSLLKKQKKLSQTFHKEIINAQ